METTQARQIGNVHANTEHTDHSYIYPPGGDCHTKAVGVCHQSPMEHMEREKSRNLGSPRENY